MILNRANNVMVGDHPAKRVYSGKQIVWQRGNPRIVFNTTKDYILTDIVLPQIKDVVIEARGYLSNNGACGLYGTRVSATKTTFDAVRGDLASGKITYYIRACDAISNTNINKVEVTEEIKNLFIHQELNNSYVINEDTGEKYLTPASGLTGEGIPPYALMIGAINNNGAASNNSGKREIYELTIWEKGMLTHHLTPRKDQSGLPCVFDDITKKTYYGVSGSSLKYEE